MKALNHLFPADAVTAARVLVVGDVMLDRYWFGDVHRISPEAPVPVVHVSRSEDRLGGAANVARNIVALGAQATLIGVVGRDDAGEACERLASEAGMTPLLVYDAIPTTVKMRVMGRQQQLLRVDVEARPQAAALLGVHEALQAQLARHDIVVFSDYAKGVLDDVAALIPLVRAAGLPVLVDPKGDDYSRYRGATLVSPNRAEMQDAVGRWRDEDDLERRAEALRRELELEALLVTRSEQGLTLYAADGRHHIDAQAHEVFDVSGAGDTVLATTAVMRAIGLPWPEAVAWANRAAGIVVGKLGTSIVTPQELQP